MSQSSILQRGLSFPGSFNQGFDSSHIASKGISPTHGGSFVFKGINGVNLFTGKAGTINNTPVSTLLSFIGPSIFCQISTANYVTFTGQSTVVGLDTTVAAILVWNTNNIGGYSTILANGVVLGLNGSNFFNLFTTGDNPTSFTPSVNVPYFVVVSINGANRINWIVRRLDTGQIVLSSSVVPAAGAPPNSGATVFLGNNSGSGQSAGATIAAVMQSYVYLSLPQLIQWSTDPWSFWYPNQKISSNFLFGNQTQAAPFDGHYNSQIYKLQRSFY